MEEHRRSWCQQRRHERLIERPDNQTTTTRPLYQAKRHTSKSITIESMQHMTNRITGGSLALTCLQNEDSTGQVKLRGSTRMAASAPALTAVADTTVDEGDQSYGSSSIKTPVARNGTNKPVTWDGSNNRSTWHRKNDLSTGIVAPSIVDGLIATAVIAVVAKEEDHYKVTSAALPGN